MAHLGKKQKQKRHIDFQPKKAFGYKRKRPLAKKISRAINPLSFANVVFHLGFTPSFEEAMTITNDGFVVINDKRCEDALLILRPGNVISLEKSINAKFFLKDQDVDHIPPWLEFDSHTSQGKILREPTQEEVTSFFAEYESTGEPANLVSVCETSETQSTPTDLIGNEEFVIDDGVKFIDAGSLVITARAHTREIPVNLRSKLQGIWREYENWKPSESLT